MFPDWFNTARDEPKPELSRRVCCPVSVIRRFRQRPCARLGQPSKIGLAVSLLSQDALGQRGLGAGPRCQRSDTPSTVEPSRSYSVHRIVVEVVGCHSQMPNLVNVVVAFVNVITCPNAVNDDAQPPTRWTTKAWRHSDDANDIKNSRTRHRCRRRCPRPSQLFHTRRCRGPIGGWRSSRVQ